MLLADNRRLVDPARVRHCGGDGVILVHPGFRMWVLANRPVRHHSHLHVCSNLADRVHNHHRGFPSWETTSSASAVMCLPPMSLVRAMCCVQRVAYLALHAAVVLYSSSRCHSENPDRASEVALLRKFAPSVSEQVLGKLADAFSELRDEVEAGALSHPYSTRELVAVAKHLQVGPPTRT